LDLLGRDVNERHPHGNPRSRTALTARWVLCCSVSVLLLAGVGVGAGSATAHASAHAAPSPPAPPSPLAPPAVPGSDNPTTIPTDAPTLPGQGGPPEPAYSEPPDNIGDSKPPEKVDPHAPGLRLADGAKLAPSKVLDIKFVTEDLNGEERHEESTRKAKFTLQAEVLFPKNSSKLNAGATSRIKDIAKDAGDQHTTRINVFGFTDDLGSYAHGKTLSRKRADAVQQELAKTLDVGVAFNVRGYSEDYPVADNRTEAGREKNRRVEVSFPRDS
jgi:outer membrane protein OmpA-like peptidoglycan-associated protein